MPQSSIFPIFLRAQYRDDGQAFSRFQSDAQRAAMAAKREFQGVSAALDSALSRGRNTSGSLDLGVDELRRAALAQQQVAVAAREVAEATRRAATANGQFDASMSRATRAAFELANAEDRATRELLEQVNALEAVQRELNQTASATDLVTAANRRGNAARGAAVKNVGAERTAFIQLGQQLQDMTVQAQLGTSAFVIFGQQVPQAAFALSGLADSTNRTKAAIGSLATFMSGPFGALIFVGVASLGPLVARLFEAEKAADDVRFSSDALGNAQSVLANAVDIATGKINTQSEALRNLAAAQVLAGQVESARKQAELRTTLGTAAREKGDRISGPLGLPILSVRPGAGLGQLDGFLRKSSDSAKVVRSFLDGDTGAGQAIEQLRALEKAGDITQDKLLDLSATIANLGVEQRNSEIFAAADRLLRGDATAADRGLLLKPEGAKKRTGRADNSAAKAAREAERLASFGEDAAEQIKRVNERFGEQPRLITQAAQATRQLDAIIRDLAERKPVNFEELIAQAETAKQSVEDALLRPFEQLRLESEQRLQIEQLLAQGREVEAAALQEVLRLEQQIGAVSAEQRAEIEGIVRAEAERTAELRVQQRLFAAQLDVIGQVERSLTDLLSGRSTDFFGDFRQALQDIQGQRLFEDIFGQAFRDIEQELRGNSPQGRANAAFIAEVERTAGATKTAGDAAITLAEAFDEAFGIVTGAANRTLSGGANDNEAFQGQIVVERNRTSEVQIARLSINELANRISREIGESIAAELEDVLGPRFAGVLGDVIGGFIAGKTLGGTAGGVLGALRGGLSVFEDKDGNLSKGLQGLSDALGKAGEGAAVGSQVAGLSNLLGIRGSTSGAQIGGAIGSVIPIPGGNIIGAIAGNILGGLLKGTPRGSATIGGVGSSLGVTGVVGNRGSLKDASGNLAGSVLEAIDRIAEQLGASVNASAGRVSIGQRKDNLRVDPRGGGATKIGNGAIDFGQDAEAAIAFAVRDLIQDGVITGLRASEQRLLRAGNDIEAALQDVLTFRSVFDRLEELRDPLGGALRRLNTEFDGLRDLFERAGASTQEFADLEELYSLERARAIEEASDRVVGSLRQLLNDLTIGDSGLSLRSRRANALGEFNGLAERVAAGDTSAFDDFAEISQQLLDIERELFGSTQSYFDRLAQITALTEQAIAGQGNVTSIAAGEPSPFGDASTITRTIEASSAEQIGYLRAINDNLIALNPASRVVRGGGGGNGFRGEISNFPTVIQNF